LLGRSHNALLGRGDDLGRPLLGRSRNALLGRSDDLGCPLLGRGNSGGRALICSMSSAVMASVP
jgi:hypothetical protein